MDLSCSKCNQKYRIPDHKLDDKELYFFCEKCNNRIEINQKNDSWFSFKGLASSALSAKDILEGIYYSFNLKNNLITFFLLVSFTLFLLLITLIAGHSINFFVSHPLLSGFFIVLIYSFLIYIYDTHIYFISRNIFHRIDHNENIKLSDIKNELINDSNKILILSVAPVPLFFMLFFPVILLQSNHSFIYSGLFHLLFLIIGIFIISVFLFKSVLLSFMAMKSRGIKFFFKSLIQFIKVENINIPSYIVLINIISSIISLFLFGIISSAFLMIISTTTMFMPSLNQGSLLSIFSGNMALFTSQASSITGGMVMILIAIILISIFVLSYIINLSQSLSVISVYIMEKNPGKSISRQAIITASGIILLFITLLIFIKL